MATVLEGIGRTTPVRITHRGHDPELESPTEWRSEVLEQLLFSLVRLVVQAIKACIGSVVVASGGGEVSG